jgi:hypothetical protein
MSQILFVAEVPPNSSQSSPPGYPYEWQLFEREANTILKTVKPCTRLQQNVWLLPAENTLPALTALGEAAGRHSLAYSCVLIPVGAEILAFDVKPTKT